MVDVLRIDGLVTRPVDWTCADLHSLAAADRIPDIGRYLPGLLGEAVWLRALIAHARPAPEADYITVHAADGQYAASVPIAEVAAAGFVIFALNGEPLSPGFGGPFRLMVPGGKSVCNNVKFVARIELTAGRGKHTAPEEAGH